MAVISTTRRCDVEEYYSIVIGFSRDCFFLRPFAFANVPTNPTRWKETFCTRLVNTAIAHHNGRQLHSFPHISVIVASVEIGRSSSETWRKNVWLSVRRPVNIFRREVHYTHVFAQLLSAQSINRPSGSLQIQILLLRIFFLKTDPLSLSLSALLLIAFGIVSHSQIYLLFKDGSYYLLATRTYIFLPLCLHYLYRKKENSRPTPS